MCWRLVGHHPGAPRPLDHDAVGADVAHAGLRVLGHPERRGEVRRRVEAGRRDGVRELEDAVVLEEVVADVDLLEHRAVVDERAARCSRRVHLGPALDDVVGRAAEGLGVDLAVRPHDAHRDRPGVLPAGRVGHLLEEERRALLGRQAAELQPHQRHELGVLADGRRDASQEAGGVERRDVLAEVACSAHPSPPCIRAGDRRDRRSPTPARGGRASRRSAARSPGRGRSRRRTRARISSKSTVCPASMPSGTASSISRRGIASSSGPQALAHVEHALQRVDPFAGEVEVGGGDGPVRWPRRRARPACRPACRWRGRRTCRPSRRRRPCGCAWPA